MMTLTIITTLANLFAMFVTGLVTYSAFLFKDKYASIGGVFLLIVFTVNTVSLWLAI